MTEILKAKDLKLSLVKALVNYSPPKEEGVFLEILDKKEGKNLTYKEV